MNPLTCLNGTLTRIENHQWQWSDGTPAPQVRDDYAGSYYNFRCCQHAGETHVEVLLAVAHRERETLGWVLAGVEAGRYPQTNSGDHTGPLVITDEGASRMHIEPGEDPLLGNEPILRKRSIPLVALIPFTEWDDWAKKTCTGAVWPASDERAILAKAKSLGWVDPR